MIEIFSDLKEESNNRDKLEKRMISAGC